MDRVIMDRGRYVGPRVDLQGETALLRRHDSVWMAQFDTRSDARDENGGLLWVGWHRFALSDFELITD